MKWGPALAVGVGGSRRDRGVACDPLKLPTSGQVPVSLKCDGDPESDLSVVVRGRGDQMGEEVKQFLGLACRCRDASFGDPAFIDEREAFAAAVAAHEALIKEPLSVVADADAERVVAVSVGRAECAVARAVLAEARLAELRLDVPLKALARRQVACHPAKPLLARRTSE